MNSCPTDLLPEYYREALPMEDMEKVRLHVEGCDECRKTVELFAALDNPVAEPPPAFWASLPAMVTEKAGSRNPWGRIPVWAGGVAAAAAVVLLITISLPGTKVARNGIEEPFGTYEQETFISMSLEEAIWDISGSETAFVDKAYEEELLFSLELNSLEFNREDPLDSLFGAESMELMDRETIRLFERMITEMMPVQTERG